MKTNRIFLFCSLIAFIFALGACESDSLIEASEIEESDTNEVEEIDTTPDEEDENVSNIVYPQYEVIEVNISIDEVSYQKMLENAMDEEYFMADITYNGYELENIAIRTKGNSSLKHVAESNDDRFSFNIDLNYYEDQDLFGIDKLILNNMYLDPTYMAEFLAYEALNSLDGVASRTTYTALYINGDYFGLYLSVEHIGNEFLDTNFGNSEGEFYKPEIGVGADLNYQGDTFDYTALEDKNADGDSDNSYVIELMEKLESGDNIEDIFDVDGYLKYLAVSTYTVNLDLYQGGMSHNYYLYNNAGTFEWIAWDLNMAFNGFPGANCSDSDAIGYLIDEPTNSAIDDYPLIDAILSNDEYLELYHSYLNELATGYFEINTFTARVNEVFEMIDDYVKSDSSSFYSYQEFVDSVYNGSLNTYSIVQFVDGRTGNVLLQLEGVIPSTNNGEGNGLSTGMGEAPGGMPNGGVPTRKP